MDLITLCLTLFEIKNLKVYLYAYDMVFNQRNRYACALNFSGFATTNYIHKYLHVSGIIKMFDFNNPLQQNILENTCTQFYYN